MTFKPKSFSCKDLNFKIRAAVETDGKHLSELRVIVDRETENFDRESGEDFINIILTETNDSNSLFLVADVDDKIVGFIRAKGNNLKRTSHRIEFGVAVLKEFWGYSIGKNLLTEMINWADSSGIRKISLQVLETNQKAIKLYKSLGFKIEGVLKEDKQLTNGYYNTILMGRINTDN
ncbi:GNAT family acetyltransferase [Alkalihalobacillus alcalophilus ATCC 27647 = CGMCC 1.3604]|uniref:GNAT family acetyltransferase n=1 Tax=Alkalihalobacillus alcalophilus ATCC 27647 = CGMCC 1.3604 TaxID=1218173 RepID=A0A094XF69_ALKAL|nr:GNAT family N-acetyltransferase [Alkalihalobacillus alcalophilus]KGA97415.1 GNAT family acetyltransferase [Alkalihalobacillus alcalophilus ATCC 27647 = CGMCC 1.3604]MED1561574.1 GNAT family N-acetyltransferase [Alkalihalobacillus alcalophilus]THG90968.1 GNAT family acetyltransferase [Alkalihalobacillus alcalophilus ATCC 27647 = CGMCC 1.3604]